LEEGRSGIVVAFIDDDFCRNDFGRENDEFDEENGNGELNVLFSDFIIASFLFNRCS